MPTDDFFRAGLDDLVDLRHPLAVLVRKMPWPEIETALAPAFAHKGRAVKGADMFDPTLSIAGAGVNRSGWLLLPIRLMVSQLYLKHAFNQSDESVVERWSENVVWQLFSRMECHTRRCRATPPRSTAFARSCEKPAWISF